jgi:hypothetical protein
VPGISALDQGGGASVDTVSCASPARCSAGGYFYPKNSQREYLFVVNQR